jgi:GntR family transcriptional regulator
LEEKFRQVVAEFEHAAVPGMPKHVRLRNAVISAIRKGYLKPGDQLPPEQEFSRGIGLSLGTVQRALSHLANERAVMREQGRGTFISKPELPLDELWQYRFVDRYKGVPLPVTIETLDRRLVVERGPWLDAIGYDERGYCELTRMVTVDERLRCLSRFYARISRFPKLMKMPQSKIPVNLKKFLAEEFDTATQSVEQFIQPCVFAKDVCSLLKIEKSSSGMLLNSVGRSTGQEAITFQSLWIPAGDYYLEIAAGGRPPDGRSPFQRPAMA